MNSTDQRRRVAEFGMQALKRALDSLPDNGALMPMLFTEAGGSTQLERVEMESPEESIKTAQMLVMEKAPGIELYAIAYVGFIDERAKNDFSATAAPNWKSAMTQGQAALLVEAGDRHVEMGMLMAVKMLCDEQGPYLEAKPSAFTGTVNFLAGALKVDAAK